MVEYFDTEVEIICKKCGKYMRIDPYVYPNIVELKLCFECSKIDKICKNCGLYFKVYRSEEYIDWCSEKCYHVLFGKQSQELELKRLYELKREKKSRNTNTIPSASRKPTEDMKTYWIEALYWTFQNKSNNKEGKHFNRKKNESLTSKVVDLKREGNMIIIKREDNDGREYIEKKDLTVENIDELAKEYCLIGKWLIFLDSKNVDAIWTKIREAVMYDELSYKSAKVSTRKGAEELKKDEYVICVYTQNYLDEDDVMKTRDKLRELGITWKIYYKPDIYTYLDIYKGKTKLNASKYNS